MRKFARKKIIIAMKCSSSMKRSFYIFLLVFLQPVFITTGLRAQTGKLFTSDYQLSSSLVKQVYQDSKGFVWIASLNGLDRYDGGQFRAFNQSKENGSLVSRNVNYLQETASGQLLIGLDNGLYTFDYSTEQLVNVPLIHGDDTITSGHVSYLLRLRNNDVLISTSGLGLYRLKAGESVAHYESKIDGDCCVVNMFEARDGSVWFSIGEMGVVRYDGRHAVTYLNNETRTPGLCCFVEDKLGQLYVGSSSLGLLKYDKATHTLTNACDEIINVLSMLSMPNGDLLIGTDGEGLKTYKPGSGALIQATYYHPQANLRKAKVTSLLKDRNGNLWMSLFQAGVYVQPQFGTEFLYIGKKANSANLIGENCVMSVAIGEEQTIWVGTDHDGLYIVNSELNASKHFSSPQVPTTITALARDKKGRMWIGAYEGGAGMFDSHTGKFVQLPFTQSGAASKVFNLKADNQDNLWIATLGDGLKKYNITSGKLTEYRSENCERPETNTLTNQWVCDLCLSKDEKKLYVGMSNGLACLDIERNSFVSTYGKNCVLLNKAVHTVIESAHGGLWVGTNDGVYELNARGEEVRHLTHDDGLADNYVASLQLDTEGQLWISTFRGMSKYNTRKKSFSNYYASNGLQGNEFSERASCKWGDKMLFAGINGISIFDGSKVKPLYSKLDLSLVEMFIRNERVNIRTMSGRRAVTVAPVMESDHFTLSHKDNSFVMRFSTMSYAAPEGVKLVYSINNSAFMPIAGSNGVLSVNNMSPGTYRFRVKAIVNDQESAVKDFKVVIRYPWYASWWAYVLYVGVFVLVLVWYIRNRHIAEQTRLRLQEHMHAEEINEMKLQTFMNLNHEIRTPMTLIVGPLQNLIHSDNDESRQRLYSMMRRNAERILALINQILDLRKIDKGQMEMKMQEVNIVDFVRDVYELFDAKAREKSMQFNFIYDADNIPVWIDKRNFDKVIVNLLSNAFKYTPSKGSIGIKLWHDDKQVVMEVSDNGLGIDPDKMDKIFNRFYQSDNSINQNLTGSGIGLNLTQQLILLHHGQISVSNLQPSGCVFKVVLPLGNEHLKPEEIAQPEGHEEAQLGDVISKEQEEVKECHASEPQNPQIVRKNNRRKTIVIAEDDEEIRHYLEEELRPYYIVKACANGKEALSEVLHTAPSLVLSDVMMPEMDGYTLCAKIKTNINVNFVPVVILTAKTRDEDKIEGLSTGADAYIEKPFNIEVLKHVIRNQIASHETLRNKLKGNETVDDKIEVQEYEVADNKLLNRIVKVINDNINNPDLSVELISKEVGISRSHLHRKMKELTNQGPRDFVRNVRLKKAAGMFDMGHRNVTQVMEACGFDNAASFSIKFKALYGLSPSAYIKERHEANNKARQDD